MKSPTLNDVEDDRCIGEGRQEKASVLDGMADGGDAGALELVVALEVPVLTDASLGLHPARGLQGVEAVEPALGLPPLLLLPMLLVTPPAQRHLLDLSEADMEKKNGA